MYEKYGTPPADIVEKARRLLRRGMPNKRIRTATAIRLRDECSSYIEDLSPFEYIPPWDAFVGELRDIGDAYQEIVDRRLNKELV